MTRTIDPLVQAAIDAPAYRDVYLVALHYDEGVERVCTAPFSIWFDDDGNGTNEFLGVGNLGNVSAIEEGSELQAYGITLSLSGVDTAQVSTALNSSYQGRIAYVWLCFLDDQHEMIADPVLVFSGMMDTMPIEMGKETSTIGLTVENVMARWETPNPRNQRYTNADQQDTYPGDLFFEFSGVVPAREIVWGKN